MLSSYAFSPDTPRKRPAPTTSVSPITTRAQLPSCSPGTTPTKRSRSGLSILADITAQINQECPLFDVLDEAETAQLNQECPPFDVLDEAELSDDTNDLLSKRAALQKEIDLLDNLMDQKAKLNDEVRSVNEPNNTTTPSSGWLLSETNNRAETKGYCVLPMFMGVLAIRSTRDAAFELRVSPDMSCVLIRYQNQIDGEGTKTHPVKTLGLIETEGDIDLRLSTLDTDTIHVCPGFPRYDVHGVDRFPQSARIEKKEYLTNSDGTIYFARTDCENVLPKHVRSYCCHACHKLRDKWLTRVRRDLKKTPGEAPKKKTPDKFLSPDERKEKKRRTYNKKKKNERRLDWFLRREQKADRTIVLNPEDHAFYDDLYRKYVIGAQRSELTKFLDDPSNKCSHLKKFFKEQVVLSEKTSMNHKLKHGHRWSTQTIRVMLAMYTSSSSAYNVLKDIFILPHHRTLQRYVNAEKTGPGLHARKVNDHRSAWNMYMKSREVAEVAALKPASYTSSKRPDADTLPKESKAVTNSTVHFSLFSDHAETVEAHPGWNSIVKLHDEDANRSNSDDLRRTASLLKQTAVRLCPRSKQRVPFAKAVGDPKVSAAMRFSALTGKNIDYDALATAEYLDWLRIIFNEGYLSHEAVKSKTDPRLIQIKESLTDIHRWVDSNVAASVALGVTTKAAQRRMSIDRCTVRCLNTLVNGMDNYLSDFFDRNPGRYFKFLRANQSALESVFSQQRQMGGGASTVSVANYARNVEAITMRKDRKLIKSCKSFKHVWDDLDSQLFLRPLHPKDREERPDIQECAHGILMFDEMKIKQGLVYNTSDGSIVGFACQDPTVVSD